MRLPREPSRDFISTARKLRLELRSTRLYLFVGARNFVDRLKSLSPLSIKKETPLGISFFMERETRLELATSSLARMHSTTELLPHYCCKSIIHNQFFFARGKTDFFSNPATSLNLRKFMQTKVSRCF